MGKTRESGELLSNNLLSADHSSQTVNVGSAITFYGGTTGIVSATSFSGSGASLTGITTSQIAGYSGGGSVAGSDGQIQYNNGGAFGGAAQLYYDDSNNRLGINSSSPQYSLDLGNTGGKTLRIPCNINNGTAIRVGCDNNPDVTLFRVGANSSGTSDNSDYGFSVKYLGTGSGNANAFAILSDNQTGTAQQSVTILQDGKVGILESSPSTSLDVNGTVTATTFSGSGANLSALPALTNSKSIITPTYAGPQTYTVWLAARYNVDWRHYVIDNGNFGSGVSADRTGDITGDDIDININVGDTLILDIATQATLNNAAGPTWIKTATGTGSGNAVTSPTATNNGSSSTNIIWTPTSAGTYYYQNGTRANMWGRIIVSAASTANDIDGDDSFVSGINVNSEGRVTGVVTFNGYRIAGVNNRGIVQINNANNNLSISTTGLLSLGENLNVSGVVTATTFDGNLTGSVSTGDGFGNGVQIGAGNDLYIYETGSDVGINYQRTGTLFIRSDGDTKIDKNGSARFLAHAGGAVDLYYNGSKKIETTTSGIDVTGHTETDTLNVSGVATASSFYTGAEGSAIRVTSNTISGPAEMFIDPAAVGDNTGLVRIKGDLYVDGTTTQINSTTLEIADFIVGIASTATTDSLADGAGIQIGPSGNSFLYDHSNTAFTSSENLNVASGHTYKIAGTDVLSATTLGSAVVNSSLTSVGTLSALSVRDSKANLIVAKDGLTVKSNSDLHTTYDMLQIGAGGALASYSTATATADTQFIHNAYRHSGGTYKYRYADSAARIRMNSPAGAIIFDNAASGSADGDITFSERLRITSAGVLNVPAGIGPQIKFENQHSVTTDAAISTFDDANGVLVCVGSNYSFNSSGAESRYNTSEESCAVVLNRTGDITLKTGGTSATATTRLGISSDGQSTFDKGAPGSANQVIARFQAESSRRLDIVWHDSGSLLGFDLPGSHSYIFKCSGSERLRITSAGKVCINNDTALSDLHVCTAGSSEQDGTFRIGGNGAGVGLVLDYDQSGQTLSRIMANDAYTNSNALLKISVDGDLNTNQLVLKGDGNIGIGTANPSDDLSILADPNSLVIGAKDSTRGNHIFQLLADDAAGNGELRLYKNSASGTHEKTVEIAASGNSYINSGSNFGIGQDNPQSKLQIENAGEQLRLTYPSVASYIHEVKSDGDYAIDKDGTERLRISSDGSVLMGGQSGSFDGGFVNLELRKDSTTVGGSMTLVNDQSANASSTCEIDCYQNYRGAGKIVFGRENANNWQAAAGGGASFLAFHTNNAGTVGERIRIDSTGRVHIGRNTGSGYYASPLLQVHGHQNTPAGAGWMSINSGNDYPSNNENVALLSFVNGANGEAGRIECEAEAAHSGTSSPGRLVFKTTATGSNRAPAEKLRLDNAGRLLLNGGSDVRMEFGTNGTTGTNDRNWVRGSGADLMFNCSNGGKLKWEINGTEVMRLTPKLTVPNVYSGTTTGGGPVYVESDGDLLRYTSSLKYKTDVETIEDARADAILNVRPVWYRSKCENDVKTEGAEKSDWGWYGFIAEEVAEIEPRLVNWATKDAVTQEDGTFKSIERDPADYEAEGVRYDNFVPLLVNLVKRQKTQIEALEKRLTDAGL